MARAKAYPGAEKFLPDSDGLSMLAEAAERCRGCDLYARATQTVFGAGPRSARLVLVGEQPGDVEDRRGEPFVGPAGKMLDRALTEAGIERANVYLTNAVKHFKWRSTNRGPRRIHDKPDAAEIAACRPWFTAELHAIRPSGLVALGATAAQSLFGPGFRLTQHRGEFLEWPPASGAFAADDTDLHVVLATIHPSAVLRADAATREQMYEGLVRDLASVATRL
jgi:uracil-DNA glycosylase